MKDKIINIIKELRPKQWYKQFLIFIAILLSSSHFYNLSSWLNIIFGVISFCLVCSGVYIFNDINDVEEDRQHPIKKNRPIASGAIGIKEGFIYACIFFFGGLIISYFINFIFFFLVLVYIIQNILYSIKLKHIYLVDLIVISIGMVIRVLSGYLIIQTKINYWVIVLVFIAAFYLAVSKRIGEYELESGGRKVFQYYTKKQLYRIYNSSQAALIVFYTIFSLEQSKNLLIITLIFAIYAVFRYDYLVNEKYIKDTPRKMFIDKPFLLNLIIWLLIIIFIIHFNVNV